MKQLVLAGYFVLLSVASIGQQTPDLVITSSVTPNTAVIGTMVTASFTVTNAGTAEAGASKVVFYQSTDNVLTPGLNGDVPAYSYPIAALAPGATTGAISGVMPVPCTQVPGTYYVFLVADGEGVVAESNENNNQTSNSLTVQGLDLTVTPTTASVCAGTATTFTASGTATYAWSPATGLNATTGATVTATPSATTTYTVTGTTNGCNVTKTVTVNVTPITTPSISISYSGCPASNLTFTATTANGGSSPQVQWFVNNTASGTGNSFTLNNATNGTQVYAKLTSNASCITTNTATSSTITLSCVGVYTTDLVATGSITPASAVVGSQVSASFSVSNTGNTASAASKALFYASPDGTLTPGANGDLLLGTYNLPAIAAGGSTGALSHAIAVPCTLPPASYTLFVVADGENVVSETNENNNTISSAVTVQGLPAITVTPGTPGICTGSSVALTAGGATSYSWSPANGLNATTGASVTANPAATTTYTITGTTNGCNTTKNFTVTVTPTVRPTITIGYTGCGGNALSFTATTTNGGTSPQVEWFVNTEAAGTGNTFTLNNPVNGTQVYARLTSNAACASPQSATSLTEVVNCTTTALPHIEGLEEVVVLPNPTNGMLAVRMKLQTSKAVSFRLFDIHGREVSRTAPQRLAGTATRTLDLRNAAAGVYYLQVQVGKESFTEKIIRLE